jgi:ParB family chromosome partitioning protein
MGHARAILGLQAPLAQIQVAEMAAAKGLSVRQVETIVKQMTADPLRARRAKAEQTIDPNVKAATDELERALGTRVRLVEAGDHRGRIEIEYYSQAELDRLFQHLVGSD